MSSNEIVDPAAAEADRRAERAKASLLSRIDALKHKLSNAKDKLDLPAQISNHALPAVGIAFALGVAAGLRRGGNGARSSLGNTAVAAIAAIGVRVVRELAMGQLGVVAKRWWAENGDQLIGRASDPAEPGARH